MSDHLVRSTAALRAEGMTASELARAVSDAELARVRRGAYVPAAEFDGVTRHRQLIAATRPLLHSDAVLSHASAAVLHGLPTWDDQLRCVSVDRARAQGGRVGAVVHVRPVLLDAAAVTELDGLPVTDLARTVVDCARVLSYERGVAVADAALRRGLTREELVAVVSARPRRVGNPRARRVVEFADGRSESVGESVSRVVFARVGVPEPVLQYEVVDERTGEVIARCDFGWPEFDAVGEFDGRVKYGRLLRPGETPGEAVFQEKRREDAIRETGRRVIRWCWDDILTPTALGQRVRRFLRR